MRRSVLFSSSLVVLVLVGCGGSDAVIPGVDSGGGGDGSVADGGNPSDGGNPNDGGNPSDTGQPDSGQPDSGACTCVPPAAMGWGFTTLDRDARDPCPPSYGTPVDLLEGVSASPAQCGCTCQGVNANPTCPTPAQVTVTIGDAQCLGGSTGTLANNAACNVQGGGTGGNTPLYGKATSQVPNPVGGSCKAGLGTAGLSQPTFAHQGRACAPTSAPGACGNGDACVPNVNGPWGLCVGHDGDVPCPQGYPQRRVVAASISDTRGCSACTCGLTAACDNPTLAFYGDGQCANGVVKMSVNQACTSLGLTNFSYASWALYGNLKSAACNANAVNPTGTVTLQNPRTVCCRP
jgi:hypothetical protein